MPRNFYEASEGPGFLQNRA